MKINGESGEIMNIYLDDLRPCPTGGPHDFVKVETAEECIELLRKHKGHVNILSLDNDLGEGLKEGRDVVKAMLDEGLWADQIFIHSANPVGVEFMYGSLINARKYGIIPAGVKIHRGPMPWYDLAGDYIE